MLYNFPIRTSNAALTEEDWLHIFEVMKKQADGRAFRDNVFLRGCGIKPPDYGFDFTEWGINVFIDAQEAEVPK